MFRYGEPNVIECNHCGKRIDDLPPHAPTTRHYCAYCADRAGMTIARSDDAAGPMDANIKALDSRDRGGREIPTPPTGGPDLRRARALYERHHHQYDQVLRAFHRRLRRILAAHGFNPTIKYRVKSFDSYIRKLQRLQEIGVEGAPTVVRDILAVRVSAAFLEDVEHICDVITKTLPIMEIERKGEQASNAFGYESVHLIVRLPPDVLPSLLPDTQRVCEIQVRTILQDAWAEVEHELVYGASLALPHDSLKRKLASLSAMLGLSDSIFQEIRDGQKQLGEHADRDVRSSRRQSTSIQLDAISETPSALAQRRRSGLQWINHRPTVVIGP